MDFENIIEVRDLSASIDGIQVLSDVSFTAEKGYITAVIGGSGAGKTTVLRHLLGLYPLTRGYVSVLGRDISRLTEKEQIELYMQTGVFFQNGALLNSMTVGENVALPLVQHTDLPEPLIEEIVLMKLGLVNLEESFNLYPSQLSGGMLKRAALARAIVMDPPLLFCDEPGSGLDPLSLESLDYLIMNLKNRLGMSILIITHEIHTILRVADKIVFLQEGNSLFEGSVDDAVGSNKQELKDFFSVLDKRKHSAMKGNAQESNC